MTATRIGLRDPYDALAPVYDQDSHTDIPRAFFRSLRPLVAHVPRTGAVLDLGCGSGLMMRELLALGRPLIGVDRSPAMLALARRRCEAYNGRVRLVQADLASPLAARDCALAVASGDVVNHFPSLAYLQRAFAQIRRALRPGGCFVFDALNRFCFETYWRDRTYLLEGPNGDVVMECDWDPGTRRGRVRMVTYLRTASGAFAKRASSMTERLYEEADLDSALGAAGFDQRWRIDWSPWPDQHREPSMDRSLWCAFVTPSRPNGMGAALEQSGFSRYRGVQRPDDNSRSAPR